MKKILQSMMWLSALVLLAGCSSTTTQTPPTEGWAVAVPQVEAPTAQPKEEIKEEAKEEVKEEVKEEIAAPTGTTTVVIETDMWTMEAVLYDSTPAHRDNFVKLANEWYYDDLLFHRVIKWFMIQGGDPDSRGAAEWVTLGRWWPDYKIDAEIGAPHFKGTLAAARQWWGINPEKKSSGSQFYIVQWQPVTEAQLRLEYTPEQIQKYLEIGGTPMLDGEYTVFGEVTVWLDVIDKIADTPTARGDRPIQDIKMKIRVKE